MTEICRSLRCPRNGTHLVGECGPTIPTPDPVTQAEQAAFGPAITVQKIGYQMPVSCCLLDDVECQHPPAPKPTRRRRLRWWLAGRWDRRPRVHFGPCEQEDCW